MNIKALIGVFGLFMSYISALSLVQFPLNLSLAPGSDYSIQLEGNDIAAGDYVRIELWDNRNSQDVNAAVVAEEAVVGNDLKVDFEIPADFPKTKNAFLRVFYKCHNAVSPRFIIKPENCLNPLQPSKPSSSSSISMPAPGVPLNVPRVIYQSPNVVTEAAPQAEAVVIVVASGTVAPTSSTTAQPTSSTTSSATSSATATATSTSASAVTSISSSTSTSSASVAKFSTSSIAVVLAVVLGAILF